MGRTDSWVQGDLFNQGFNPQANGGEKRKAVTFGLVEISKDTPAEQLMRKLCYAMERRNLTAARLARKIKVESCLVREWKKGYGSVNGDQYRRLCGALQVERVGRESRPRK